MGVRGAQRSHGLDPADPGHAFAEDVVHWGVEMREMNLSSFAGVDWVVSIGDGASSWTLTLARGSRMLDLAVDGQVLHDAQVKDVSLGYELSPSSVYGEFDRGATQRIASTAPYFASTDPLHRFYAMGGGAVDMTL